MGALLSFVISARNIFGLPVTELQSKYNLTLPKSIHTVLPDDVIEGRRVFIIGDVHGCYDELLNLLKEADVSPNNTVLVFVGDLVNKGPKSLDVLRFIRQNKNAYCVRGNHEEVVLRELKNMEKSAYQIPKKYEWILALNKDDINYLKELPYTISIPKFNAIIVHAGLVPGKPLFAQQPIDMVCMRNLIFEDYFEGSGIRASDSMNLGESWATLWPGPTHVYFGHDSKRKLQIAAFATGLDTGCVYGGRLTGVYVNLEKNWDTIGHIISVSSFNVYQEDYV